MSQENEARSSSANGHESYRRVFGLVGAVVLAALVAWFALSRLHGAKDEPQAGAPSQPRVNPLRGFRPRAAVRPSSIGGTVRDRQGEGIEGAVVCAVSVNSRSFGSPDNVCAGSNADGDFALEGLAPGGYVVRGAALGYAPGVANAGQALVLADGEQKTEIDLLLMVGGARLSGMVVDGTGGPVPQAVVRAVRLPAPSDTVDVTADDQGRFELSTSPGKVMLTAKSPGYANTTSVFSTAPSTNLVLVLTPGATISGTVVTPDGTGVPGMRVFAQTLGASGLPSERSAPSNEDGEFTVSGLAAGSYELTAEGDHVRGFAQGPFEVDVADSLKGAVVIVQAATAVSGRVVMKDTGEPCQSGKVTVWQPDESPIPLPTVAALIDANGGVLFENVPPGTYGVDVYCADHRFIDGPQTVAVGREDLSGLIWTVGPGQSLVIRTVDERDRPVPLANFQLRIPQPPGEPPGYMLGSTDTEGRYTYPAELEPGHYEIAPGNSFRGERVAVELKQGAGQVTATLRLDGSGALAVSVRTSDGTPVDSVVVTAAAIADKEPSAPPAVSIRAIALGDGRFRAGPLPPGRYEVRAEDGVNPFTAATGSTATVTVAAGSDTEASLTVDRGASISGVVLDSAGAPKENVWVSASRNENSDSQSAHRLGPVLVGAPHAGHRALSDLDGRFRLEGLQSGALFDLHAGELKGGQVIKRAVRAGAAVSLAFPPVGTLRGTALDGNGRPVAASAVRIAQVETGWVRFTSVKPDGSWEFKDVAAGHLRVFAGDSQGRVATDDVELGPRQTLDQIRLVLVEQNLPKAAPAAEKTGPVQAL